MDKNLWFIHHHTGIGRWAHCIVGYSISCTICRLYALYIENVLELIWRLKMNDGKSGSFMNIHWMICRSRSRTHSARFNSLTSRSNEDWCSEGQWIHLIIKKRCWAFISLINLNILTFNSFICPLVYLQTHLKEQFIADCSCNYTDMTVLKSFIFHLSWMRQKCRFITTWGRVYDDKFNLIIVHLKANQQCENSKQY